MFLTATDISIARATDPKDVYNAKTKRAVALAADVILGLGIIAIGIIAQQHVFTLDSTLTYGLMGIGAGYAITAISIYATPKGKKPREMMKTLLKIALAASLILGIGFGANMLFYNNSIAHTVFTTSLAASLTSLLIFGLHKGSSLYLKEKYDLGNFEPDSSSDNSSPSSREGASVGRQNDQSTATTVKASVLSQKEAQDMIKLKADDWEAVGDSESANEAEDRLTDKTVQDTSLQRDPVHDD